MTTKIHPVGNKAKIWQSQKQRVFQSLHKHPQTRLQVANATHTPIQNVTRYVADFRREHQLFIVRVDKCPISGMQAEIISTNPMYSGGQLTIF